MPVPQESQSRTRAFARALGPFLAIAPAIIALRASSMGALTSDFFRSDYVVWFTGAALLFGGIVIIAFHQYWSNVAAVLISVFGWFLALRGMVLMVAPDLYERAALSVTMAADAIPLIRLMFGVLAAIGLYLTFVGWRARPVSPSATHSL
jgi:hypothetical protein